MDERLRLYERLVTSAVADVVAPAKVTEVVVRPDDFEDEALAVAVHVGPSGATMPPDILLTVINAASEAIERTGERRFPAVFAYFSEGQQIEAA